MLINTKKDSHGLDQFEHDIYLALRISDHMNARPITSVTHVLKELRKIN